MTAHPIRFFRRVGREKQPHFEEIVGYQARLLTGWLIVRLRIPGMAMPLHTSAQPMLASCRECATIDNAFGGSSVATLGKTGGG